ncbi:DUF3040 domain-containing protein [Streptomyces sp. NPDC048018]|uniref:DUF3040 domain-containing protein n=1 Tax=Streptomyces sp. NPDC048018 TaxID=3365499 RepID=UPI00371B34C4
MDGAQLSPRERRILEQIEHDLDEDAALARTFSTGHRPRRRASPAGSRAHRILGSGRLAGPAAAVLGPVAVVLFVIAVVTESAALIWAFAVVWVLTLICLMRLVLRWSHRHLSGDERPRPDDGDVT